MCKNEVYLTMLVQGRTNSKLHRSCPLFDSNLVRNSLIFVPGDMASKKESVTFGNLLAWLAVCEFSNWYILSIYWT